MAVRPGGDYAGRPLHVIWLLDCSGSMAISGKIEALNNAIREVVPAMRKAAEGNPEVQFYVRVIRFSSGATWHIAQPTLLSDFKWVDLHAEPEFLAQADWLRRQIDAADASQEAGLGQHFRRALELEIAFHTAPFDG